MGLARDFKETVVSRVKSDPAFAQALLDEALTLLLNGDPETAKLILRDLVNATIGFEASAGDLHKPSKSLHRMLSRAGNPTMEYLWRFSWRSRRRFASISGRSSPPQRPDRHIAGRTPEPGRSWKPQNSHRTGTDIRIGTFLRTPVEVGQT